GDIRYDRRIRGNDGPCNGRRHGVGGSVEARAVAVAVEAVTLSRICVLGCVLLAAACARGGAAKVRIAIGGQNQLIYLPTTLARELGYYKEEGLDVELQDFQGG